MTEIELQNILENAKTIAVVGMSDNPERDSHRVGQYLRDHGYRIYPVNPTIDRIDDLQSYPSLMDVPEHIDVVDIFRRSEAVPEIVDDAIAVGAGTVWMQLGVVNQEAADKAREAGLRVVMDRCMEIDHRRLLGA